MKPNKSIDGLAPRSAKTAKSTPRELSAPKKPAKQSIKVKEPKIAIEKTDNIISDESLDIKIEDDFSKASIKEPAKPSENPQKTASDDVDNDFLSPVQALNLDEKPKKSKKAKKEKDSMDEKKEKKKPGKARIIITSIALIIVIAIIGVVLWAVIWGNDIIAKITGGQGNVLDLLTFMDENYEPLKTDANDRTNILAFGTSGYDMQGDEGDGVHDGAALTDSIMMISLNQETGDIAMLSLPRDLKASPTCTATGKINEVYWCNNTNDDDEAAGAAALMTEVGDILGVDFQYYAHLNWGSLVYIVDVLGGITITLDEDIFDYGWTDAVYEAGIPYTINGEEALGLARARHGTSGGDFSRGASQQKILVGIKDRIFEKDLSLTDMLGLASNLGDNLRTNFNISELKTLAHLTYEFDFDSMRTLSLYPDFMTTGTLDNGISYVFPRAGVGNYGDIQAYVSSQLSNDPRTYEEPTILVLNATDTVGLANTEKVNLVNNGYPYVYTDNAPAEGKYEIGTTLYVINDKKPGSKKLLESYYGRTARPLSELPAGVPQDYDFVVIVNPESEAKAAAESDTEPKPETTEEE